jgi:hypothetical protein
LYGHWHICLPTPLNMRPESASPPARYRSATCTAPAAP